MTHTEESTQPTSKRANLYLAILRVFEASSESSFIGDEARRQIRASGESIDPAALLEALTTLKEAGLLRSTRLMSGGVADETTDGLLHDRLSCTLCGFAQRFEDHVLHECRKRIAREYGFEVGDAMQVIYAHCLRPDCSHFRHRTLTLM